MEIVRVWLAKADPDVLCIQETKAQDKDFPLAGLEDTGYRSVFRGQKAYNGVALLSKVEARDVRCGLDDGGPPDEARLLYAKVGPVHVVNTYVPQGREIDHEMYQYKLEWFRRLKSYFDRHFTTRQKLVWLGDMNVAPQEMDVFNPKERRDHVCFHIDARNAFADTVAWGFVDVFRKHHPEPGQFSFFDYRTPNAAKRGMGWRIDHVLATPGLAKECTGAFIDLEPRLAPKPSDHTFVVADFDV